MKRTKRNMLRQLITILIISYLLTGCACNDEPYISHFAFHELNPVVTGIINNSEGTILLSVPEGTDITTLTPTIEVANPECHTISPPSNTPQDFTGPVLYKVRNEKGEINQYEVSVIFQNTTQLQEIIWEKKASIPVAVGWMPAVELENKIYVISGAINETDLTNNIFVYDPVTDIWDDSRANIPIGRFAHSANVVNGKIYVMGGATGAISMGLNDILVYDPLKDLWENEGTMPFGRAAHGSCVIDGKIYVIGGELEEPTRNTVIGDVSVYDPGSRSWTSLAPLPTPRAYLVANAVNGKIYAAGGTTGQPYDGSDVIEEYDPISDTWSTKSPMLYARWALGSTVVGDKIYYMGGAPIPSNPGSPATQAYEPKENKWYQGTNLNQLRTAPAACSWQGKIYVLGGANSPAPWPDYTAEVEAGEPSPK